MVMADKEETRASFLQAASMGYFIIQFFLWFQRKNQISLRGQTGDDMGF